MFPIPENVESAANVGCCGIDGCTSTLIGASLINAQRLCFLATGDLAFFYDLNSLGNRHVNKNIRILLVNNGIGGEFKLAPHMCTEFGDEANKFMAAGGHFGNKSPMLVKHYAEDLGFKYLSASNKEEYLVALNEFVSPTIGDKPIIFEVFTDYHEENAALEIMRNLSTDSKAQIKSAMKSIIGKKGISAIKSIVGK